jgi:dihydrolipoamide dehydrogenase
VRFVILGGGPAGNQAATNAARHGAKVTLVEREVVGGAAHLWDCIPSKAMIATGGAMSFVERAPGMGLVPVGADLDVDALKARIASIEDRLRGSIERLLADQWWSTRPGDPRRSRPTPSSSPRAAGRASPSGAGPTATAS